MTPTLTSFPTSDSVLCESFSPFSHSVVSTRRVVYFPNVFGTTTLALTPPQSPLPPSVISRLEADLVSFVQQTSLRFDLL